MKAMKPGTIKFVNTTKNDLEAVLHLFDETMQLQGKNGYIVWDHIDKAVLVNEIENGRHYKILDANEILGIFSVQYNNPFIWRDRDHNDAIYLHRIIINPKFKGQKQLKKC